MLRTENLPAYLVPYRDPMDDRHLCSRCKIEKAMSGGGICSRCHCYIMGWIFRWFQPEHSLLRHFRDMGKGG